MIKKTILFTCLFLAMFAFRMDKPAYKLFDVKGKPAKFKKLYESALKADVILFGELHNNPISHWLQLELTKSLFEAEGSQLSLGAEMFEADNQLIVDEYTSGFITKKNFDSQARLWPNYKTDYKPLLDFAREHQLHFVASNVPRRYASLVFKKGLEALDSLSPRAKEYLAPLPFPYDPSLPNYLAMSKMMGKGHANSKLALAQALKDATMAYRVGTYLQESKGKLIHFNGSYHSQDFEGMYWYLKKYFPELQLLTIATVEQKDITELDDDNVHLADYTIAVPADMTKTH